MTEPFLRLWDYYLCYCEGAFREKQIGVSQLLLQKPGYREGPSLASSGVDSIHRPRVFATGSQQSRVTTTGCGNVGSPQQGDSMKWLLMTCVSG